MVFRQLQLALALAAFASSACGEGSPSTSSSIAMDVDSQTCATDVGGLRLNCDSTAVVVVEDEKGARIADGCANLPVGALINSADAIQESLSLGTLPSDQPLSIRLAIYSGQITPCPNTEQLGEPLMFGNTSLVILQEEDGAIPLLLRCGDNAIGLPQEPNNENCSECEGARETCIFLGGVESCEATTFDCQSMCANNPEFEACLHSCDLIETYCSDGDQGLQCNQDSAQCFDSCEAQVPGEVCGERCAAASQLCQNYASIRQSCESQYGSCLQGCGNSSSCLSFNF